MNTRCFLSLCLPESDCLAFTHGSSWLFPPYPTFPPSESVAEEDSEGWQMGNVGAEAAAAAGGAAGDGPGAAAEASGVMTATGGNVPMI